MSGMADVKEGLTNFTPNAVKKVGHLCSFENHPSRPNLTMKTFLFVCCAWVFSSLQLLAATADIIEAGPHHRVWQIVSLGIDENGKEFAMTNSFTELKTGMNRFG